MPATRTYLFPCVESCTHGSQTARGLSIHQAKCKVYKHVQDRDFEAMARQLQSIHSSRIEAVPQAQQAPSGVPSSSLNSTSDTMSDHLNIEDAIIPIDYGEPPPPEPLNVPVGRGHRRKRPTWKVLEQKRTVPSPAAPSRSTVPPAPIFNPVFELHRTSPDRYGLYSAYETPIIPTIPNTSSHNPTPITFIEPASQVPSNLARRATSNPSNDLSTKLDGCSNKSSRLVMNWFWKSSSKSLEDCDELVHEVIRKVKQDDLANFSAKRETALMDAALQRDGDTWHESTVSIQVPDGRPHPPGSNSPIPLFSVPGLMHRSVVEVIKETWSSPDAPPFQYVSFRQYWAKGPTGEHEHVYGELYTSDAFLDAHEALQHQLPEEGCDLERVICAVMLYSDSTHLASFGDASLWPLYMYFGNQSKYERLPDSFHDFYLELTGEGPPADVLTHCRRELMHSVLRTVFDSDFLHAYEHGIVLKCPDGITRRIFPRIFTYSADYPEKVLLASIRNLGTCPCPRCEVKKAQILQVGTIPDTTLRTNHKRINCHPLRHKVKLARAAIYERGKGVKSTAVEDILSPLSYVPTSNAFADLFGDTFNYFSLFVVDLMHELELGVWKALLIHLIRMLVSLGGTTIQLFNERFRQVPTFGRSKIRRFDNNTSALKKLAARNYEDMLQGSNSLLHRSGLI
ncbi:hypothetical protein QCA50_007495 [Cerrena zonata]|uniref:Transposase n=1 Tax=Cerrena zonata TaxID=2478898 RepID=A0AAW0G8C8_9APHY